MQHPRKPQPIDTAPFNEFVLVSAGENTNPGAVPWVIALRELRDPLNWKVQFGGYYQGAKWWLPLPEVPKE